MASIRKHHEDFIRELQASLKSQEDKERKNRPSDNGSRISASDIELLKELERKFDELFGSISDDADDSPLKSMILLYDIMYTVKKHYVL